MKKTVYQGKILSVVEEKIGDIVWEKVYLPDGVIILPINDLGEILLIEERRPHETPNKRLKPVSGIIEYEKGTPLENAEREMQEEIGFKANQWELLLHLKGSGTLNHQQFFYVAKDLSPSKLPNPDGEDTILSIVSFSPEELRKALDDGRIPWSLSTLGLLKLLEINPLKLKA